MNAPFAMACAPDEGKRLARFCKETPRRTITDGGWSWSYRRLATQGPPLLMLTGALGKADFGFGAMSLLGARLSVIAPDYPPVTSLDDLVRGLCAILDSEGIARAHVLGGSFGGVAAQAFARQRPDRVASLILSHTGAARQAPGASLAVKLLALLPERLLRGLFRRRVRAAVAVAGPFWVAEFEEAVARLTKADILSRALLAAEFGDRYGSAAQPPAGFPVLILDSSDDPLIRARDRLRLRASYPAARLIAFEGTGHLAAILRPDAFADAVSDFVRSVQVPGGSR